VGSKDVPCNNWLHFMVRENKLHMNIAVRSNDIIWGFSGINTFEWSVLQEMLAFWLGAETDSAYYFISSFHLYQRHFERASNIIHKEKEKTLYDFGFMPSKFRTPFSELSNVFSNWFAIETKMRNSKVSLEPDIQAITDDFLRNCLSMLNIYNLYLNGVKSDTLFNLIADLPISDFRIGAIEYFTRKFKSKDLRQFSEPERHFFDYFWSSNKTNI
jgi:thymidylate synthase